MAGRKFVSRCISNISIQFPVSSMSVQLQCDRDVMCIPPIHGRHRGLPVWFSARPHTSILLSSSSASLHAARRTSARPPILSGVPAGHGPVPGRLGRATCLAPDTPGTLRRAYLPSLPT